MNAFFKNNHLIEIAGKTFTLEEFQNFEPDYSCDYTFEYFGPLGHWLSDGPGHERASGESLGLPSRENYITKALSGAYSSPDWAGFYNALLGSTAFSTARTAATQELTANVAYTDCSASLGLAAQGAVNLPAIQASITALAAAVNFNQAERAELDELIQQYSVTIFLNPET